MTSAECECEDDVDIYGDLPNVPCIGDTIKEVSIKEFEFLYYMSGNYRTVFSQ
jgi:hypothetical protein